MNPKPAKAPFDFGLDFFSSVPPTSSTPDTTMTSLNSTMLASPGVMLGGGVEHKKQMSDTISLDSFGDDSGMRPGDWQYVSSLSLSLSSKTTSHTNTNTHRCPTRGCRNAVPGGCYGSRKHCKLCGAKNPNLDSQDEILRPTKNVSFENRPITKVADSYFIAGKDIYCSNASATFRPIAVGVKVSGVMRTRANRKDRYPWRAISVERSVSDLSSSSNGTKMGSGDLEMIESLQAQLVLERQKSTVLAAKVQELEARQRADAWMVPRLVKLLQEYCRLKNSDFASVVSGMKKNSSNNFHKKRKNITPQIQVHISSKKEKKKK